MSGSERPGGRIALRFDPAQRSPGLAAALLLAHGDAAHLGFEPYTSNGALTSASAARRARSAASGPPDEKIARQPARWRDRSPRSTRCLSVTGVVTTANGESLPE